MSKSLDRLVKLADAFDTKLAQRLEPLKPLQPMPNEHQKQLDSTKIKNALEPMVKSVINTLEANVGTQTIKVKFNPGIVLESKQKYLDAIKVTAQRVMSGYNWKVEEQSF